ncbi:MAG: hypothetical protein ABWY81_02625 [Jiangellaceae bacterium]
MGESDYESGELKGWRGNPYWTIGFAERAESDAAASWERLALAVGKASRQFMNIDEDGNHVPDDELGDGRYTPSYVSEPFLGREGVSVYADTGGYLTVAMGKAMLRALVGALGRLAFDTHITRYEQDSAMVTWRPPHLLPRGEPTVIARAVRCVVNVGVPDVITEYLDTQGGWTTSLADARVFERDERGTHGATWDFAWRLALSMYEQA